MFFDVTKKVTLSPTQERSYLILRSILFLSACVLLSVFVVSFLLPSYTFQFTSNIDSLANTITRPETTTDTTSFSVVTAQDVNRAHLTLTLSDSTPPEHIIVTLQKSYGAFLYPQVTDSELPTQALPENAPFPDGSLIASREGVYVTSGTTKYAFDTEETFLASGYDFDNVIDAPSDARAFYKTGKIFSLTSYHPAGTVFYAQDTGRSFLVGADATIAPVATQDVTHAIIVDEESRAADVTCTLQKALFPRNTYTCDFDISAIAHFPGKRYHFATTTLKPEEIKKMTISLSTKKSFTNILTRFITIKTLLRDQYSQ